MWVEAYIDGQWVRFDPTPPARNAVINSIERPSKIKLVIDSINYYYNAFIINYDFSKQMKVYTGIKEKFSRIGEINTTAIKHLLLNLIPAVLLLIFTGLVYLVYRQMRMPYEVRLVRLFLQKIKKYGYTKTPAEGFEEFCSKIDDKVLRDKAMKVVREMEPYLYGNRKLDKQQYLRLKQEIEKL